MEGVAVFKNMVVAREIVVYFVCRKSAVFKEIFFFMSTIKKSDQLQKHNINFGSIVSGDYWLVKLGR